MPTSKQSQTGAVLIIALIFLTIMATLAASSMQATGTNERLAGNIRDSSAAFQAAEATLKEAEANIASGAISGIFSQPSNASIATTNLGQYPAMLSVLGSDIDSWRYINDNVNSSGEPLWEDATAVFIYRTAGSYLDKVLHTAPSYIVEEIESRSDSIGTAPPVINTYYRITARAIGLSPNSEVVLQTTFKK